ncbi:MAG: hypothetical protein KDJ35_03860 [Alphaproteobacteria bacterium]|nr:hypothetical protein [Alphaproteobacteria bacterium]
MALTVYNRIKSLIEETNDAFSSCRGAINTDYAEFATMSLSDFKAALEDPRLTSESLVQMLRTGSIEHRSEDPESCWATFMAHYMARTANKNTETQSL